MSIRDLGIVISGCIYLISLKGCAVRGSEEELELEDVVELELGDLVRIAVSKKELEAMQEGHGDYNEDMAQDLGRIGEVTKVRRDGDVAIKFEGSIKSWIMNPKVLSKKGVLQGVGEKSLLHRDSTEMSDQFSTSNVLLPEPRSLAIDSLEENELSDDELGGVAQKSSGAIMDSDEIDGTYDNEDMYEAEDGETGDDETENKKYDEEKDEEMDEEKDNEDGEDNDERDEKDDDDDEDKHEGEDKGNDGEDKDDKRDEEENTESEENNEDEDKDDKRDEEENTESKENNEDEEINDDEENNDDEDKDHGKMEISDRAPIIISTDNESEENKAETNDDKMEVEEDNGDNIEIDIYETKDEEIKYESKPESKNKDTEEEKEDIDNIKIDIYETKDEKIKYESKPDSKKKDTEEEKEDTDKNNNEKYEGKVEKKDIENENPKEDNTNSTEKEDITDNKEDFNRGETNQEDIKECPSSEKFRCSNGECIPKNLRCNGHIDCPKDMADEYNCTECQEEAFHCGGKGDLTILRSEEGRVKTVTIDREDNSCIPNKWKCDGAKDCKNGRDEADCRMDVLNGDLTECPLNEFRCSNGECIPENLRCNGRKDCPKDIADEHNCTECQEGALNCGDGNCIPKTWKCDGAEDCKNARDEAECRMDVLNADLIASKCGVTGWECYGADQCIPNAKRCDGDMDCENGSDEVNCTVCRGESFNCDNGECVPYSWRCDGEKDCANGHDEKNCDKTKPGVCLEPGSSCANNGTCRKKCKVGECDNGICAGSDCKCCIRTSAPMKVDTILQDNIKKILKSRTNNELLSVWSDFPSDNIKKILKSRTNNELLSAWSDFPSDWKDKDCGLTKVEASGTSAYINLVRKGTCDRRCIRLLMDIGADINTKITGKTALWYAINQCANCKKDSCAQLLVNYGADIEDAFHGPERTETKICDKCFELFKKKKDEKPFTNHTNKSRRTGCKVDGKLYKNGVKWEKDCCLYTCSNGRLEMTNVPLERCKKPEKRCSCCKTQ